jgi:hypothetical protein
LVSHREWTIVGQPNESHWDIITEEAYAKLYAAEKQKDTFLQMAGNMDQHFSYFGLDNNNAKNFMALLSSETSENIRVYISEVPISSIAELYEFRATYLI